MKPESDDFPVELSEEMEEKFDRDIDTMEKLVEVVSKGLGKRQSLNDLAQSDEEALITDIVLPHLKLYDAVADSDFARDTVIDAIQDLRSQLLEDGPKAVETVDQAIVSWNKELAEEVGAEADV